MLLKKPESAPDDRLLHLRREAWLDVENSEHFKLLADNPDPEASKSYCAMTLDLLGSLARGRVVEYAALYKRLAEPKSAGSPRTRPCARYDEKGLVAALHKKLLEENYQNGWFDVQDRTFRSRRGVYEEKALCMIQERFDPELFLRFMAATAQDGDRPYHGVLNIHEETAVDREKFTTPKAVADYFSDKPSMILAVTNDPFPTMELQVHPGLFPIDELLALIEAAAARADKVLNIDL